MQNALELKNKYISPFLEPCGPSEPCAAKRCRKAVLLAAAVLWGITFLTEPLIFDISCRREQLLNYVLVKLLLYPALVLGVTFFVNLADAVRTRTLNAELKSVIFAVPLWVVVFYMWIRRGCPFRPEEMGITESAMRYDTFNDVFTYITSYLEMMALMVFPAKYFTAVLKILLLGLDVGYAVSRACGIFRSPLPVLTYVGFLAPPGLLQSYSLHRCPMYGALYFFLAAKLLCDYAEHRPAGRRDLLIAGICIAALTWWRSEGIYLLVFGPLLVFTAYRIRPERKRIAGICAGLLLLQLIVWLPTNTAVELTVENYEKHKTTPFFNYALTGMLCNGLDREKNAEDLEKIEYYMHIDFIDILNALYGEHIYDEGHATYHEDYRAMNFDATDEEVEEYEKNVTHLILKNPLVFIKGQIHAFSHISFHYDSLCLSAVFGNLWVVVLWLAVMAALAAVKKKWFVFWLFMCPIAHGCITTVFLPAAYFKYYYPEYAFAWLTVPFFLAALVSRKKNGKRGSV